MHDLLMGLASDGATCTVPQALTALYTVVHTLLMVPYPNVLKKRVRRQYDFIIAGAGSAGCVLADRLSENPNWSVLLLEAGGEEPRITRIPGLVKTDGYLNTSIDWNFQTEPHPEYCFGKPCTYGRGKMLGGSDGHNGMWYLKCHKKAFDDINDLGIEGWSYEDVSPYYDKRMYAREEGETKQDFSVERFRYVDQNVGIIMSAYKDSGYAEPDRNGDAYENYLTTSKNGERISSNRLHVEKLRFKRPNLHVVTDAFVTRVLIDPETKTATGVEVYINEGGEKHRTIIKARKEVIVSCGVIGSPKLLQLSGVGPANILKPLGIDVIKELKVGYNLMNHLTYSRSPVLRLTTTSTVPRDCETIHRDIVGYLSSKSGPLSASGAFLSFLLLNSSRSTADVPDLLLVFNPYIEGLGLEDPKFCTCYYNTLKVGVMSGVTEARGSVVIKSKDPLEPPLIRLGYSETDAETIAEGMVLATKIVNSKIFKKHGIYVDNTLDRRCTKHPYGTYKYWKCAIKGKLDLWLHGMSTCRMGPATDKEAVVDNKLRVYGIKKLRVIDASVFPVMMNANTNSMALMVAERGADFIKEQHSRYIPVDAKISTVK